MKENIFDVLMYLFDNYMDDESEIPPDNDAVKDELLQAGFGDKDVARAFDWLESLSLEGSDIAPQASASFRVFSPFEKTHLDVECQNLILMKLKRTKQIEDNLGKTIISEGIEANYLDMINYAVFALIKIEF